MKKKMQNTDNYMDEGRKSLLNSRGGRRIVVKDVVAGGKQGSLSSAASPEVWCSQSQGESKEAAEKENQASI